MKATRVTNDDDEFPVGRDQQALLPDEQAAYNRFRLAAQRLAAIDLERKLAAVELMTAQTAWLQIIAPTTKEPA